MTKDAVRNTRSLDSARDDNEVFVFRVISACGGQFLGKTILFNEWSCLWDDDFGFLLSGNFYIILQ